jgi:hypothetical protein
VTISGLADGAGSWKLMLSMTLPGTLPDPLPASCVRTTLQMKPSADPNCTFCDPGTVNDAAGDESAFYDPPARTIRCERQLSVATFCYGMLTSPENERLGHGGAEKARGLLPLNCDFNHFLTQQKPNQGELQWQQPRYRTTA